MAPPSAAMSLRESFGDRRRLPDITRKITACVACRKQKIKCHMNGVNPPCSRCKDRGLSCTVNKSLQMLLENDAGWKEDMELRIRQLEEAFRLGPNQPVSSTPSIPESQNSSSLRGVSDTNVDSGLIESSNAQSPAPSQPPKATGSEVSLNLSCNLGSFPGSSIVSLTFAEDAAQLGSSLDLITRGQISLEAAEDYFTIYQNDMEPCICRILEEDECLSNIRSRSSFLTAAICAVKSLSADAASHQTCYDAFIKEVSSRVFSSRQSFDDVRALCIGAFWLQKVSSTLVGLAVRMANDLNLHRCITKMPHTKTECYERTRLYLLVYICDHHLSLVNGKPPMTHEFRTLKSPEVFLQSSVCKPDDIKLISQVELWSIGSHVFDVFGADTEASITNERVMELDYLSSAIDLCRSDISTAVASDDDPGDDFSRQLFELYIHCAKLYLFSHAFRGTSQRNLGSLALLNGVEKFARGALESALAVVRLAASIQAHLESLPSYFGTMVAFASVSLIKAWGKEPYMSYLDKNDVSSALGRLVEAYQACSARVQSGHPLWSVARSLRIAMNKFCPTDMSGLDEDFMPEAMDSTMLGLDDIWGSAGLDYLGDYNGLLSSHSDEFHASFFS